MQYVAIPRSYNSLVAAIETKGEGHFIMTVIVTIQLKKRKKTQDMRRKTEKKRKE
jgi:hypothetical protein